MDAAKSAERIAGAPAAREVPKRITIEVTPDEALAIVNAKHAACTPPQEGFALMWLQQRLQELLNTAAFR